MGVAPNLLALVPRIHTDMVAALFRTIFVQPDADAVAATRDQVRDQLAERFPKIGPLMDDAKAEVLAFRAFPKAHWQRIWSTNPLERINKEIKRRSRVVGIFPNEASVIRLVGAVLAVVAAVLGWLLMRRTTKPLEDLTAATERVAATRDLTPLGLSGTDEVGRLGGSFDEMLDALRTSREQQRRLVEDTGHELRTPLTSLRANVEFLQRAHDLPSDERVEILAGVQSEIEELGVLVDEVVVLATDDLTAEALGLVRDEIVRLAANSIDASSAPAEERAALRAELTAVAARS